MSPAGTWQPTSALAHAVDAAGFRYDPDQDIIYSRMDAAQRDLGYAAGYDAAALGISANLHCEPIFFDHAGKHWMIELWKGQYGLETGCEIGVYTRPIGSGGPVYALLDATVGRRVGDDVATHNLFYDGAADADMLTMSATLVRHGEPVFTRGPERHWWLTGFRWGLLSDPADLSVRISITLLNEAMLAAFTAAIADRPYPDLRVDGTTVSFTFATPFAGQPPRPQAVVERVNRANEAIVRAYADLPHTGNDPNDIQADILRVVGLSRLHRRDQLGRTVGQLAVEAGQSMGTVVDVFTRRFGVAASTVVDWLSGATSDFATWVAATQDYLGLPLNFTCYVEIDNTHGASDLLLTGHRATHGSFVVGPPAWIGKGTTARLVLRDPKPSIHGSAGSVTYAYATADLAMTSVDLSFECPTLNHHNAATASRSDWVTWAKSGDAGRPWRTSAPARGHPLFVSSVIGGGRPA